MKQPYKEKPKQLDNQGDLLTVSAAASVFGVTSTTIRNWDKSGKLVSHRHPKNDYRLYSFSDLAKIVPANQRPLFVEDKEIEPAKKNTNSYASVKDFRSLVRQMSKAFRDSQGGNLMDRFEEISKILYTKMQDERTGGRAFAVSNSADDEAIYDRISKSYQRAMQTIPPSFRGHDEGLSKDKRAVVQITKLLNGLELTKMPADIKGTAFEELIKNTFDKTEHQQFFTPRTVVNFIIQFIDINGAKTVLDPACGTAGFLIEASSYADKKTNLVGIEIDKRMAWISQMNLQIHGFGNHKIHCFPDGGSLSHRTEIQKEIPYNSVEVIVTNPPFGSDFTDAKELKNYKLAVNKKSRRRGVLFIERCISWLKPEGKLGIIIDDGVLNSSSNYDVRKFILENCILEAVISLPTAAFLPYASVKSSILFLKKKSANSKQGNVFMADAENVGRRPNGDPYFSDKYDEDGNPTLVNDLPQILNEWIGYKKSKKLSGTNENVFLCPPDMLIDKDENKDLRIDLQFHHPSKQVAREVLQNSTFPVEKLSSLVGVRNVNTVPNVQDPEDIWNYVGLANIVSITGEFSPIQTMGNQIKSAVKLYKPGDILFSKLRPELRKVVLVPEGMNDGFVSSECYVLTTGDKIDKDYLVFLLRSDIVLGQLVYQVSGVGRPRINIGALLSAKIPLPALTKQKEIVRRLKKIETSRKSLEKKIQDDQLKVRQLITETSLKFKQELLS
ncbi:MAG: N-6 DNA methylase [Patescibacteria group bacterium]